MIEIVEILASWIENLLILSTITEISGRKQNGKKFVFQILGLGFLLTLLVSILNTVSPFSFLTIFLGAVVLISVSKLLTCGGVLIRSVSCILALFFLHSLDYITGFTCALLIEGVPNIYSGFDAAMTPGETRFIYTTVDKSIQTLLFLIFRPHLYKISSINQRALKLLLCTVTGSYILMSVLLGMIITDSLFVMQVAIILTWFFIMVCTIALTAAIIIAARYQNEKTEKEVMLLLNKEMMKNYQRLSAVQTAMSRQVHDFTNHLRTLDGLSWENGAAQNYIKELLKVPQRRAYYCRSGNEVIDSIINCKVEEANDLQIPITFTVRLETEISISPVDLCAILANQIDNAIEACEKILEPSKRFIKISILQKRNFLFFKVENSAAEDPFDRTGKLISRKVGSGKTHGLGVKNIAETAEKYNGSLDNSFKDGCFSSIVMLQNE